MDRRTTPRGVSQVPAVLRLRVDASICATEPNTPAPHGDLDRWPEVALYCSRRWLLHKAVCETLQRARESARQGSCARRSGDERLARKGRDDRFRSPPLEAIQRARRELMQQPPRKAEAGSVGPDVGLRAAAVFPAVVDIAP